MPAPKNKATRKRKPKAKADKLQSEAPKRMRRKYFPSRYNRDTWDRAALAESLNLASDKNASPRERAQALSTYAQLRKALDSRPDTPGSQSESDQLESAIAVVRAMKEDEAKANGAGTKVGKHAD